MMNFPIWKRVLILAVCVIGVLIAMPNAFYGRVERANDARAAVAAGAAVTPELQAAMDGWPAFLPSKLVPLGLDLRGGAHLLVEVQLPEAQAERLEGLWPELRDKLRDAREQVGTVRRMNGPPNELRVRIGEPAGMQTALDIVAQVSQPVFSITGAGSRDFVARAEGTDVVVVTMSDPEIAAMNERVMHQSLEIIRRRVDESGTREPTIQRQGADRILVQVPGIGSAEELLAVIGQTARLAFHPVISRTTDANVQPGLDQIVLPSMDETGVLYVLDRHPVVTGEQLVDSQPTFDQNQRPAVNFRFNPQGGAAFGAYTAAHIGSPFAIVLDNKVISAPVIQSHIPGGTGIITGSFTPEESSQLAILLRAGALPAEIKVLEQRTVGPELGADSIRSGEAAAIAAFVGIICFMTATYGIFGIIASFGMIMNIVLLMALMTLLGATMTMPGIAGLVLSIGMAVDANVLIYERIREEVKTARGPARAIELGFDRAQSPILDGNLTALIVAGILYAMGAGPVRGFGITLALGLLCSMFTAISLSRLIVSWWYDKRRPKTLTI
ncbi:protein translocase subunit SecD [Amaricoccus sp.]|uniref:protein translocase subunit SecD n=1 Tax=Amaricoccus sp. TaxID=1872485 RepID=UPI001B70B180|nr:protein translocase subunit SecD [Amaricoccus sp.]MBP7002422.1 protein translocase subunit SecD [Amaricoccus sp.]